jgi:peptidoglycan/LPS O-acetylase OafA/YrhL
MTNDKNLEWVQLLRGIAAVLVVLCHARYVFLNLPGFPLADEMLVPGAAGVDLFFTISGFIMCYSTRTLKGGVADAVEFAIKRFARVWPVYAVATVVSALALSGGLDYFVQEIPRQTFWHSLAMIPANPRYVPYFSLTLQVGWTLEFEMYFYAIFAASLLFKRLRWFVLASWVLLTIVLMPLAQRGLNMDVAQDLNYRLGYMAIVTNSFVLEFFAGVVIGWIYLTDWVRISNRTLARHVMMLGSGLSVWAVYSGILGGHGPGRYGLAAMGLVLTLAVTSKTVAIQVPRLFLWLGSISYSLYLTHIITQGVLTRILVSQGYGPLAHNWTFVVMSTLIALSVATLSYHVLEQGLSNVVRRWLLHLVPSRLRRAARADGVTPLQRAESTKRTSAVIEEAQRSA